MGKVWATMAAVLVAGLLSTGTPHGGIPEWRGNVTHSPIVSKATLDKTLSNLEHSEARKGGAFRDSASIETTHVVGVHLDVVE